MFDFQSLFSQEPEKEWRPGLGADGGAWGIKASSFEDDAADQRFPAFQQAWRSGAGIDEMFGDEPFKLHGSVGGSGTENHRPDVAKVETFLDQAGYYKPMDAAGPSGWHSSDLDRSIRKFQKDQGLEVDGVLNPEGPTIKALEGEVGGRTRKGLLGEYDDPAFVAQPSRREERDPFALPKIPRLDWPGTENDGQRPNSSRILLAQADMGSASDAPSSSGPFRQGTAGAKGTDLAYMDTADMLYPRKRILEGSGWGGVGGIGGGTILGGSLLDAASKGMPPSQPADPTPPLPGIEPPEKPGSTKTELIPPLIKVDGYGSPVSDPARPNVFVFPIQQEEPGANILEQRRERPETKAQIDTVRDDILKAHPEWSHVAGGRAQGSDQEVTEHHVAGPGKNLPAPGEGDSRPRGGYTDLTFKTEEGHFVHVQTVDVDPRTGKPSPRELDNAERIRRLLQRDQEARHDVYLIPKSHQMPPRR